MRVKRVLQLLMFTVVGSTNHISPQIMTNGHRPPPPFTRAMLTPTMSSASYSSATTVRTNAAAVAIAGAAAADQSEHARSPYPFVSFARGLTSMDSASTALGEVIKDSVSPYHTYQLTYPMRAEILATAQLGCAFLLKCVFEI